MQAPSSVATPQRAVSSAPLQLVCASLATPVGALLLFAGERGLLTIALPNETREQATRRLEHAHGPLAICDAGDDGAFADAVGANPTTDSPASSAAVAQLALALAELRAYLADGRTRFTVPLDLRGTDFQRRVWLAVAEIPPGETRAYSEIALAVGQPAAVRAVGAANGANPLPLIIPCHRVIGADGRLTGYGGGLPMKRWLLDHERA